MSEYHEPVLLQESVDALQLQNTGTYIDVTFGGGGHSAEILRRSPDARLIGFDQDQDAHHNKELSQVELLDQNFRFLKNNLRFIGALPAQGILADFGVSSHQFNVAERGFSFRFESELDMRMNQRSALDAKEILNTYSLNRLTEIFRDFGELRSARKLAQLITDQREQKAFEQTADLITLVERISNPKIFNKEMAKVFQALRIEVNDELSAIRHFLKQSLDVLEQGGRLVVISYHSLEDRLVKNFMRSGRFDGQLQKDHFGRAETPWKVVSRKVVVPTQEECERNPRARSAKMRIAEKL
uniref:Ribosomal RNA small subunit methyltransferase H n=1 Tax=uncultured Flavobacteriia bacterium TaxID=212695 RepID=H6RFW5_9BACT|nr:rRNA small subunit methyltransferase H [uncultured bacterium]CCF99926.1 S-adenosyl-methyltransferase MraW [uncultured Flavobacteriia bacterium]